MNNVSAVMLCRAALDRGPLELHRPLIWPTLTFYRMPHTRRLFAAATVNKLIAAGEAKIIGTQVTKT